MHLMKNLALLSGITLACLSCSHKVDWRSEIASRSVASFGKESGNGGDAIVCYDRPLFLDDRGTVDPKANIVSANLKDYWEFGQLIRLPLAMPGTTYLNKVMNVLKRLEVIDPVRAQRQLKKMEEFQKNFALLDQAELEEVNDATMSIKPSTRNNCYDRQMAVQRTLRKKHEPYILIDKFLFNKLSSDEQRAGIILHELFYEDELVLGQKNHSDDIRKFNYLISADYIENLDVVAYLDDLRDLNLIYDAQDDMSTASIFVVNDLKVATQIRRHYNKEKEFIFSLVENSVVDAGNLLVNGKSKISCEKDGVVKFAKGSIKFDIEKCQMIGASALKTLSFSHERHNKQQHKFENLEKLLISLIDGNLSLSYSSKAGNKSQYLHQVFSQDILALTLDGDDGYFKYGYNQPVSGLSRQAITRSGILRGEGKVEWKGNISDSDEFKFEHYKFIMKDDKRDIFFKRAELTFSGQGYYTPFSCSGASELKCNIDVSLMPEKTKIDILGKSYKFPDFTHEKYLVIQFDEDLVNQIAMGAGDHASDRDRLIFSIEESKDTIFYLKTILGQKIAFERYPYVLLHENGNIKSGCLHGVHSLNEEFRPAGAKFLQFKKANGSIKKLDMKSKELCLEFDENENLISHSYKR